MKPKRLLTDRLELCPVDGSESAAFRCVMMGADMGHHTDVPWKPTEKRAAALVRWMVKLNETGKGAAWSIRQDKDIIGFLRLNEIDRKLGLGKVGYEIAQTHWSRGFASEALACLVTHGHEDLRLNRLEAWALDGNDASARVLEKAAFRLEGVQRARFLLRKSLRDVHLYARLAGDPR